MRLLSRRADRHRHQQVVTSPRTPAGTAMPVPSPGPFDVRTDTAQADQARIHPAIP